MDPHTLNTAPDLPSVLTGWRWWRVVDDGAGPRLVSPVMSTGWPPRAEMVAACGACAADQVPAEGCRCGLYAVADLSDAARSQPKGDVLGCAALWGRIVAGGLVLPTPAGGSPWPWLFVALVDVPVVLVSACAGFVVADLHVSEPGTRLARPGWGLTAALLGLFVVLPPVGLLGAMLTGDGDWAWLLGGLPLGVAWLVRLSARPYR